MSEAFIGQITAFGFNFAPRSWGFCSGQLVAISQNTALFSLIGTNFGGDGRTTFALPDLRGRMPMSFGHGSGLSSRNLGVRGGQEQEQLTNAQLPSHSHTATFTATTTSVNVMASTAAATKDAPEAGDYLATANAAGRAANIYVPAADAGTTAALGGVTFTEGGQVTVDPDGGSQSFPVMNPFLAVNFCIALQGIFPSRS